ncbi:hypothetical protein D9M68_214780 [compost metagenome]
MESEIAQTGDDHQLASGLGRTLRLAFTASAIALGACTTAPTQPDSEYSRKDPPVRVGESFMVLKTVTYRDKVKLLSDASGKIHAIIGVSQSKQLVAIQIGESGVEGSQLIRENVVPDHTDIDAAFDREGQLHVIVGDEHFVQRDGAWTVAADPPWKLAGVEAYKPHFVPGWPDLLWVFSLNGKHVGSPGRFSIYAIGGYGGAIPIPGYGYATKLVVVPGSRAGGNAAGSERVAWCLVDPKTTDSVLYSWVNSDGRETIYLLYVTVGYSPVVFLSGNSGTETVRFVRARLGQPESGPPHRNTDQSKSGETAISAPCVLSGAPVKQLFSRLYYETAFAVDRDTGAALALVPEASGAIDANDNWATTVSPPLDHYIWPHIAPAGNGRFHVVLVQQHVGWWSVKYSVSYLMRMLDAWSRAIRLGNPETGKWGGAIYYGLDLIEAPGGKAFIVWPVPEGIKGQWIEPEVKADDANSSR